jgi:hypothetical protein
MVCLGPPTPRSNAANRERQQEKASDSTKKKKLRVQREKDGLSLPGTSDKANSDRDCEEGWSDFDAQEEEAPLASGGKGKDVIVQQPPSVERDCAAPWSVAGASSLGQVPPTGDTSGSGGAPPAQASKKCKRSVATQR